MVIRYWWLARLIQALSIFGRCGTIGVLLDLDHVLVLLLEGKPLTWENLCTNSGRPFHIPAVLVSGGVFCISCALRTGRAN